MYPCGYRQYILHFSSGYLLSPGDFWHQIWKFSENQNTLRFHYTYWAPSILLRSRHYGQSHIEDVQVKFCLKVVLESWDLKISNSNKISPCILIKNTEPIFRFWMISMRWNTPFFFNSLEDGNAFRTRKPLLFSTFPALVVDILGKSEITHCE